MIPTQRKDLDGQYATDNGMKVPHIYPSFDSAQAAVINGDVVIARTEHPTERTGMSGINYSHVMDVDSYMSRSVFNVFCSGSERAFVAASQEWHKTWMHVKNYCQTHDCSVEDYVAGLDYSYWEYIEGANVFVVGDPVIPHRYRVFTNWWYSEEKNAPMFSYTLFDGEEYVAGNKSEFLQNHISEIIAMYQQTRSTFGETMCWTVEMQITQSGEVYFLQRSNGKPMQSADWDFEENDGSHLLIGPSYGYGEVLGSTSEEGIEIEILLERAARYKDLTKDHPSAVLCAHINSVVGEQELISELAAYFNTKYISHGDGSRDPHSSVIPMVKSPLHIHARDFTQQLPKDLWDEIDQLHDKKAGAAGWPTKEQKSARVVDMARDYFTNPDHMIRLRLHVRSDGYEARIKVLEIS